MGRTVKMCKGLEKGGTLQPGWIPDLAGKRRGQNTLNKEKRGSEVGLDKIEGKVDPHLY